MGMEIVLRNLKETVFKISISIKTKTICQHRIKLIASASLFTKVLANFLSSFYLLNQVLKTRH
ncbi:MAG: hypothetical protein ACI8RP_001844 [Urechidicola sp.]|jgi:hypothetical protein